MEKHFNSVAVICEYNPFHHGHAYQIGVLKERFDVVVGIMSGAFVQRGDVAVADKYLRAAAAIEGGLDLAVELPFPYCCSAAPDFAAAGVKIAAALGVDALAFGCEDGEDILRAVAAESVSGTLSETAKAFTERDGSLSHPRALQLAAERLCGESAAKAMQKPNNILAVEYISAVEKSGCGLDTIPVERCTRFLSSSEIRASAEYAALLPCPDYFAAERRDIKYAERLVLNALRTSEANDLYGVDVSLAARLKAAAREACSLEEAVSLTVGKCYTAARVRRAVLAVWLGISTADVKAAPSYTNLLAANKNGTAFLKAHKKTAGIPIITKPADYKSHPAAVPQFETALKAEEAALLCCPTVKPYGRPLKATPTIIPY